MTPPVEDAAWVAGGILAATGDLLASLTVAAATERLAAALDPPGRSVPWSPPDKADVTRLEATLIAAWAAAAGVGAAAGAPAGAWDDDIVRVRVTDIEALEALGPVSPAGRRVVAHAAFPARQYSWRWPVRMGVGPVALRDGLGGDLADVRLLDAEATFELVVLDRDGAAVPAGVRAACVVLPGTSAGDLDAALFDRLGPLRAAAVVASPAADLSWIAAAVRHLACGRTLDVAVALTAPDAVVLADDGFLELTSAREYARQLIDSVRDVGPAIAGEGAVATLERLVGAPFDADGRAGGELAAVVRTISAAGLENLTTVEHHLQRSRAIPGDDDIPHAPDAAGGLESFEVGGDTDRGGDTEAVQAPAPDARRLQAQVVDPDSKEALERFVGGAVNQVKVRIAAEVVAGVIVGDALFVSPTPGRDADLMVEVIAGGTHAKRKLKLPAVGDSPWTKPVPVEVPSGVDRFEVFVQVSFAGRIVQSAVLSGPVGADPTAAPPAPGEGLRLSVDASTPAAAVHRMTPADASITLFPGLTGEPVALTFDQGQPIPSDRLAKANKGLRAVLLDTFHKPAPPTLADAAGPLTRLAIRGRLLHDGLRESTENFPGDDTRWIQVSGFGSADLPLELVYTHPKPADDDLVPVCPSALAGATECAAACPDRESKDVVCPYGFWATSKVIERRRHVDRRTKNQAGSERTITVLASGTAGVAVKADEVDQGASARILDAVKAAVAAGHFLPVSTWKELGEAAKAPPTIMVLITHTVPGDDDLGPDLQLGSNLIAAHRVGDEGFLNPGEREPGPVVIAIGCDTADLDTSFADYVTNLHAGGAELVVSAISPVPGKNVADFMVRFFATLPAYLATPGIHRFGEVLTAVRRQTVATGDVLALALTASGDGDVALLATGG